MEALSRLHSGSHSDYYHVEQCKVSDRNSNSSKDDDQTVYTIWNDSFNYFFELI